MIHMGDPISLQQDYSEPPDTCPEVPEEDADTQRKDQE